MVKVSMVNDSNVSAAGCVRATLSFSNYITGNTGPCSTNHRDFFNFDFRIIEHYGFGRRRVPLRVSQRHYFNIKNMYIITL